MNREQATNKSCEKCGASIEWQMDIEHKWHAVNLDGSRHSSTCPHAAVFRVREKRQAAKGQGDLFDQAG